MGDPATPPRDDDAPEPGPARGPFARPEPTPPPEPGRGGEKTLHDFDFSSVVDAAATTIDGAPRLRSNRRPMPKIPWFEVVGELGRGGMGVVYLARRTLLNRPCALKMILAGEHASPETSVRFLAEAEAVARLDHPNVIRIYSIGEHDGYPYLELEYAESGSLEKRLDGTPWPPRRATELIEALARGAAEAHRLGVVHRDLKPSNVLLMADGTPKLTDFGLAKCRGVDAGLTLPEAIIGSPSYMAPEQAAGKAREVGPLADVYSLGAILYELLTGRPPFRGTTVYETLDLVRKAEPVRPGRLAPGVSRDLETITLACLHKEPSRRYASSSDLADDLRRYLDGLPTRARRIGDFERLWKWALRRPVFAAVLVAWLASMIGGLAAATHFALEARREAAAATDARLLAERHERAARRQAGEIAARLRAGSDGLPGMFLRIVLGDDLSDLAEDLARGRAPAFPPDRRPPNLPLFRPLPGRLDLPGLLEGLLRLAAPRAAAPRRAGEDTPTAPAAGTAPD